ncbi:M56 family metallopeptidase [Dyadobacter arcticus]|uniref:Beta-lactamase regulating signal transducer with metallopeptidase domain n=1 Tax=Dyadobacter arcticus TaxID=1078754 RepID=A0ABX0UN44_9BACT|nr:M56 family metallopeptidase [Dyadobacter arcticus]NIJ53878.1 beta-lactamase regulating signal transducer with metallopeptidase domain [Dyadobacter arcticus]
MLPFIAYLIKLSLGLTTVSLFYHLVLRRLTFYDWNRWYLLIYSLLAFCIPFIDVSSSVSQLSTAHHFQFIERIPSIHYVPETPAVATNVEPIRSFDTEEIICYLVLFGIAIMIGRFLMHINFYARLRRNAQLVSDEEIKLYHLAKNVSPFSFGNSIFYNPDLHKPEELKDIILHEYVHVRQKHTLDVIWSELLCIVNWFNPFAWLIRHAIRQNLEFIADRKVLENHADIRQYQYLLLKVAGVPEYKIVNPFGFSSIKQRIIMMNKTKSPKFFLTLFLFTVPLLVFLLAAFRSDLAQLISKDPHRTTYGYGNQSKRPTRLPKKAVFIAGIILDARTSKPVSGYPLTISFEDKDLKTVLTDKNGYYYVEMPAIAADTGAPYGQIVYFASFGVKEFIEYAYPESYSADLQGWSGFGVTFLPTRSDRKNGFKIDFYGVPKSLFFNQYKSGDIKGGISALLNKEMGVFITEHNLKIDFKKAYPWPKDVFTKFKNGYFDRNKELIGYDDLTQFYLNGNKATYQAINKAFENYPYVIDQAHSFKNRARNGLCAEVFYVTFPMHKPAPPAALLKGNVEEKNASTFDLATLKREPYLLDGFRQVYGIGSNLMPLKNELRKVVLFKGQLARYYDPDRDRIWWIETRPETEVFERPDLALFK